MRKHRLMIVVSALSIASLAVGPLAYAHEAQPGDDRGRAQTEVNDDRGRAQTEIDDDRGVDMIPEARHGADDPAGDDRGKDPLPHA